MSHCSWHHFPVSSNSFWVILPYSGAPEKTRVASRLTNIRLDWKCFTGTSTSLYKLISYKIGSRGHLGTFSVSTSIRDILEFQNRGLQELGDMG